MEWEADELPSDRDTSDVRSWHDIQRTYRMGQRNEICAIAVQMLTLEGVEEPTIFLIKPAFSQLSDRSLRIMGVSRDEFERVAVPLLNATTFMRDMWKAVDGVPVWATWGGFGFSKLKSECDKKRSRNPFSNRRVDLKTVASLILGVGEDLPRKMVYEHMIEERPDLGKYNEGSTLERNLNISSDIVSWLTPYGIEDTL